VRAGPGLGRPARSPGRPTASFLKRIVRLGTHGMDRRVVVVLKRTA
jgi:hypothetical protein